MAPITLPAMVAPALLSLQVARAAPARPRCPPLRPVHRRWPFPHPRLCRPPAFPPPPPLLASGGLSLWGSPGLGPWLSSWPPNAFPRVAKPLLTRLLTRGEGWGPGVSGPFLQAVPAPSSLSLPWGHPAPRLEAPPRCWPASPAGAGGLGSLTASEV